jgi:hypothetical protein
VPALAGLLALSAWVNNHLRRGRAFPEAKACAPGSPRRGDPARGADQGTNS